MFNLKLRNKCLIGLLLSFGISTTSFASECDSKKLDPVFDLMVQRTKLMEGVAAYKFTQKQQPYDAATELKVLLNVRKIAEDNKLDPSDLMVFAQIQMDQAKQVQQYWLNYWNTHAANQPDPAITPGIDSLRECSSMTLDDHISSFSNDSMSANDSSSFLKSGALDSLLIRTWYSL